MLHQGIAIVEPVVLVKSFPAGRLLECALGIFRMRALLFDRPQKIESFRLTLRAGERLQHFGGAAVLAALQARESQVVADIIGLRKRPVRPFHQGDSGSGLSVLRQQRRHLEQTGVAVVQQRLELPRGLLRIPGLVQYELAFQRSNERRHVGATRARDQLETMQCIGRQVLRQRNQAQIVVRRDITRAEFQHLPEGCGRLGQAFLLQVRRSQIRVRLVVSGFKRHCAHKMFFRLAKLRSRGRD